MMKEESHSVTQSSILGFRSMDTIVHDRMEGIQGMLRPQLYGLEERRISPTNSLPLVKTEYQRGELNHYLM